jgi:formiminoglutamase
MSDTKLISANKEWWQGRKVDQALPPQYWYQQVQCLEIDDLPYRENHDDSKAIGLIGYRCDEGVRRNHGRVGAAEGPKAIRERLAKMAFHQKDTFVYDIGDVSVDQDMETGQELLANVVWQSLKNGFFPIVIGGGHDVAYGHYLGIAKYLGDAPEKRLGIVNFDAHFDLRYVDEKANSGTPFYQISEHMKSMSREIDYFVLGIQPPSNSPQLFDTAHRLHTKYILSEDCTLDRLKFVKAMLSSFLDRNDVVYLSVDLDAFSSAYAPGVSAPSPMGLSPHFVFEIISYLMKSGKIITCDIAEMNPEYDRDGSTAVLAARIIDYAVGAKIPGI